MNECYLAMIALPYGFNLGNEKQYDQSNIDYFSTYC
jgi:hypothetical protein